MKLTALFLVALLPVALTAQNTRPPAGHAHPVLGTVHFPNSGNSAAQEQFQRGVALLHSFQYDDAAIAFQAAQRADRSLALAYWLEALTYSHVLWGEEDLPAARKALSRLATTPAARIGAATSEPERAFGSAIESFYVDAPLAARTRNFADAMLKLAAQPNADHEVTIFAALASMMARQSMPPASRDTSYNEVVQQLALRVFRANPDHPGAAHYLIHFVDMNPSRAREALAFARAYEKIAPDADHALHMPSHVYLPLGLWPDVVASNEKAWAASRKAVLDRKQAPTQNSWHTLDWLQYSYLQLGRVKDARALIDTARALLKNAVIEADNPDARNVINLLSFRIGMETGQWDAYAGGPPRVADVLAQPRLNQRSWMMSTMGAYQAAVAALRGSQDRAAAQAAVDAFRAEQATAEPTRAATLRRLAAQLEAQIAHAIGQHEQAIQMLREIATTEPVNASLPPTIIPSYELLGDALLAAKRPAEAADAYNKALAARANRAAPLRGLERARLKQ